jgi:predicted nucleic acid-binding protein
MILVDTSVIVAWLDKTHPQHRKCVAAIERWALASGWR